MASTITEEEAGNVDYQQGHLDLMFRQGFSFSGFERNNLFMNLGGEKFKEISGISGIDSVLDGRAVVLADFDNDGDLDVFVTTIQGRNHLLYRNNVGQDNNFVRVTLEGTQSGKDAFGTIVRLKSAHGIQTQVKAGGSGFLAQQDPRLLFGLGEEKGAEWLEVSWSSGKVQRFGPIEAGSSLRIVEGADRFELVQERRGRLPEPLSPDAALWAGLHLEPGGEFPELTTTPVSGETGSEGSLLEPGRAHFVNLWATWCAPCLKEMPELQKLKPRFEEKGIRLVGLSLDQEASVETIRSFGERTGVTYPLYRLETSDFEKIFADDRVPIPLSLLIDEEGRPVELFLGWSAETERRVHRMLDER